jgi:alcohol dehydrogenase class IV
MINSFRPFAIARLPRIEFGSGQFSRLGELSAPYGQHVLLVTGASSFTSTPYWPQLQQQFDQLGMTFSSVSISGEPSPQMVDQAVAQYAGADIDVVIGIGGGSALDAAKAIAGLLRPGNSVMDHLEGVGPELEYKGPALPFIAVPTTAGTGSEATKNAVLGVQGPGGFKKSFRDDKLVAEVAIVDPDLLASCPPEVIAANGMDALTQLIESYVSLRSNIFCDALGISGLRAARDGLVALFTSKGQDGAARERMAYASLISGINLAQTGLGSVHGLAAPLGAFYPIPHGAVCGTLVATATETNIRTMCARDADNPALERYARISEVLCQKRHRSKQEAWEKLIELLHRWTEDLQLQKLSDYGLQPSGIEQVVANARGSSMKTNPIMLSDDELAAILTKRL